MSVCESFSFTLSILLACCALIRCMEAQRSSDSAEELRCLTPNHSDDTSPSTGEEEISNNINALNSSGPSFSDDSARSASGDASTGHHDACSSEVTVKSSDGISTDGQCLQNTITSGASSYYYDMNWPLFIFMAFLFVIAAVNVRQCIRTAYGRFAAADLAENGSNIFLAGNDLCDDELN